MRKILFRGKSKIDGGWVYGQLLYNRGNTEICIRPVSEDFAVNPESIGQYTGLCDKNGTKIFEGDIITDGYDNDVVVYGEWNCGCCSWVYGYTTKNNKVDLGKKNSVVIGNIHDNPKLLKGGAEE